MLVKAIKNGFVGKYRRINDEFSIEPEKFSSVWMVSLEVEKPKETIKPKTTKSKAKAKTEV